MKVRQLLVGDYELGLMNLMEQLTEAPPIKFEDFVKQYIKFGYNTSIYVIEDEEKKKIVGYGAIYIDYKFYRNCKNVGHIEDIIIDKDYRGKGLSKLIINKLLESAREKDCYKIILNCKDEYVGYYQKMGFKIVGNTMVI
jgi:glucosamine-phosphate N-acetyltransferase